MEIFIDSSITEKTPHFHIGVFTADIKVYESEELHSIISNIEEEVNHNYDISDVIHLDNIKQGRDAYKAYGKDPSRYRLAVESLYRRLAKGNKLYRINNVVDCGNVLSIQTRKSIAVLDLTQIKGKIRIRLGRNDDVYVGIGRGKLNIENIPLYEDDLGPFGSTTSDTERTMISSATTSILVFIISFSGDEDLSDELELATNLFVKHASAKNINKWII